MPMSRLGRVDRDPLQSGARHLETLPWADSTKGALERYREEQPSPDDLDRVDNYRVTPLEYFENPHLRVRALENESAFIFRNFLTNLEQELDLESARKVAYAVGLAHGKRRMGKFLAGQNLRGGARTMAMLQDYGHSSSGPRHATAMFAKYDGTLVEVARTEDSYGAHSEAASEVNEAFFDGFADGYMATDPGLLKVEEFTRDGPDGKTEFVHRFWYAPEA